MKLFICAAFAAVAFTSGTLDFTALLAARLPSCSHPPPPHLQFLHRPTKAQNKKKKKLGKLYFRPCILLLKRAVKLFRLSWPWYGLDSAFEHALACTAAITNVNAYVGTG